MNEKNKHELILNEEKTIPKRLIIELIKEKIEHCEKENYYECDNNKANIFRIGHYCGRLYAYEIILDLIEQLSEKENNRG